MAKKKKRRRLVIHPRFYMMLALGALVLLALVFLIYFLVTLINGGCNGDGQSNGKADATDAPVATFTPNPTKEPAPTPCAVDSSQPSNYGYVNHFEIDGTEYSNFDPLMRTSLFDGEFTLGKVWRQILTDTKITFDEGSQYTQLKGVITFRGNNFRSDPAYGTVSITEEALTEVYSKNIGYVYRNDGQKTWTGSGWTGQPLIVQWPSETRKAMNLYDWAKNTEDLVEVIYPTMDGKVHFLELKTGEPTRDDLDIGMPFKGTGSLDPRGYPILYLGSGDQYDDEGRKARAMIYSLVDFTRLYEFGTQDHEPFAKRVFTAWDSAPLIDAQTDTLIYAGENGILYTMKLNTTFQNGVVSVNPTHIVKMRYDSNRSSTGITEGTDKYWLGYEGSIAAWNGCLYMSSNDGLFQCVDLSTMQIKWIADTIDDTNGTPVLDVISDDEAYIYVGTSLHFTKDANSYGVAPFFKINALTGGIVRQYGLHVYTETGVSGGIQSTAALGKSGTDMDGLVLITIARYPDHKKGVLVALNKDTFEVKWQFDMENYSWSSPLIVYTDEGKGYVLQADSTGNLFLLDGATGTVLRTLALDDSNFEASPAVYENMLVVGCRGQKVFGVRIS